MKKYKINYKKLIKNVLKLLLIIIIFILFTKYLFFINKYNNKIQNNYNDFINYATQQNIEITQENYKEFINTL